MVSVSIAPALRAGTAKLVYAPPGLFSLVVEATAELAGPRFFVMTVIVTASPTTGFDLLKVRFWMM